MADSKPEKTYAIRGIPPPPDANFKTKTIPYAPGMPFRLEISKLFPSQDPFTQKQWTLFVLALERFKNMKVDEKLSYFQVAGIHGYPETAWDGADPPPQDPTGEIPPGADPFGGYCHHNSISFPTWHRPYMLLFEKLVWTHMNDIIDGWKLDDPQNTEWKKAANLWRLPYWDWARRQSYNDEFSLPYALTLDRVPIYPPEGKEIYPNPYPNPLWGFDNPEKYEGTNEPRKFGDMPEGKEHWNIKDNTSDPPTLPWSQCSGVSRYGIFNGDGAGTYKGLNGINNFTVANTWLNTFSEHWYNPYDSKDPDKAKKFKPPGTLADSINRMFSPEYNDSWGSFASTKWWNESAQTLSTGYLSLEYIHNNVHNISGGSKFQSGIGHMSDVPVAAFDPLFWLHHSNIDRLLAMWQALNWNAWWDTTEPPNKGENEPDPTRHDPLKPFHATESENPKVGFWTSEEVRDHTQLYYQYDDLAPQKEAILPDGTLDEERYKIDLLTYIHATYPSTLKYFEKLFADERIKNGEFFGPHNSENTTWNDYIINVVYDRYALNGSSYVIEFWLGGADDDPNSTFSFKENLIGQVYSFGGLAPASTTSPSGCANCGSQRDNKVLSRAQVPLTIPIISQALDNSYDHIKTTRGRDVVPYLQKHLHWKFVQIGGGQREASDFPDTTISVWRGTGKPQPLAETGEELPPKYADYKPQYTPTEGKDGGLTRDDELLGENHSPEFQFRTF